MAGKTLEDQLADLLIKKEKVAGKLAKKKARENRLSAISAKKDKAKLATIKRKKEILVGQAYLAEIEAKRISESSLNKLMMGFLTSDSERELFGLPPAPDSSEAPK